MTLAGVHNPDTVPLNKALDTVDHEILLTKMNRFFEFKGKLLIGLNRI